MKRLACRHLVFIMAAIALPGAAVLVLRPVVKQFALSKRLATEFEAEPPGGMVLHSLMSVDSADHPVWVVNALWNLASGSPELKVKEHASVYLGWIQQEPTALMTPKPYEAKDWARALESLISTKSALRNRGALTPEELRLLSALEKGQP
jgi:hypothetical protein